jgi:hypothetical protein
MVDPISVVAAVLVERGPSAVVPIEAGLNGGWEEPKGSAVGASNVASADDGANSD